MEDKDVAQELQAHYKTTLEIDASLFPDPGILEILSTDRVIHLHAFDATKFDLSPFKVVLVKNGEPFQITKDELHSSDEFRPVSYLFGENYAKAVVESGSGVFLESHDFAQTMTPLDAGMHVTQEKFMNHVEKTFSKI